LKICSDAISEASITPKSSQKHSTVDQIIAVVSQRYHSS
jgi:hypothetical protein